MRGEPTTVVAGTITSDVIEFSGTWVSTTCGWKRSAARLTTATSAI